MGKPRPQLRYRVVRVDVHPTQTLWTCTTLEEADNLCSECQRLADLRATRHHYAVFVDIVVTDADPIPGEPTPEDLDNP